MVFMIIFLGIDLGFCYIGYGVIEQVGNCSWVLVFGIISISGVEMVFWLGIIFVGFCEVMSIYQFEEVSIEKVFMVCNLDFVLKFGQVCGVVFIVVVQSGVLVFEYFVCQVKQVVVGCGGVEKVQVVEMVKYLLGLEKWFQEDVVDVLVIVFCYVYICVFLVCISGVILV